MSDYSSNSQHNNGSSSNPSAAALPNHQLGEVLGRGAFGCVYRALNWQTGETVAVKQIGLSNIPASELPEIMSEIDLLKNLDHPNVVQYRGFVKTGDFLWIVLEYCENGSLTAICKKFGKFPESLCQIYICQVLEGLLYLHDQGVIHRDIKGSNILATKEGSIKLADFGVATRVGGLDRSVVGSPYWMAPEVVEQSGATTASDIWSVGCTVIELLEGQPPYHQLDPMPALFRIVNDDCPPLPDSASPVVRDFLTQCFQKDGNLRISARKLLKHPWMVSARKQLDNMKRRSNIPRGTSSAYDETIARVQEWNKALDKQPHPVLQSLTSSRPSHRPAQDLANVLQAHNRPLPQTRQIGQQLFEDLKSADVSTAAVKGTIQALPLAKAPRIQLQEEEKENDNWDSDFAEGIPTSKIAALEHSTIADDGSFEEEAGDNSDTIKPGAFSPLDLKAAKPVLSSVVEDYSDLLDDEASEPFESRVADLKLKKNVAKSILHPRELSAGSARSVRDLTPIRRPSLRGLVASAPPPGPSSKPSAAKGLKRFVENDNEDYEDSFDQTEADGSNGHKLALNNKLSSRSWLGDEEADEEDPFAQVDGGLSEDESQDDLQANVLRDKITRMCSFVNDLLDGMNAEADELAVRDGCLYLVDIFQDFPEVKDYFIKAHGLLTIVESLQSIRSREVISLELRIVNLIIGNDSASLEKICLIGGCPVIMNFSHPRYSRDIRLEAALFIGAMCRTSLLTLQMFISCRGLRTLVDMMDENYRDQKDLVWMAVDGICRVFDMQGSTPRNDFCRMFAKEGLLEPLSTALSAVADDQDELAQSAMHKIAHVFLLFAQSDLKVKMELAQRPVILRLVQVLRRLPVEILVPVLKTIKNISMAPAALEVLQNANAIETLVKIMTKHLDVTEICNPIVGALYNLCRLSKSRIEEAALAGAVPILQKLVSRNGPLKQIALPILCDFAHASKTCRKILWHFKVFDLYIDLLKDPFWNLSALESILSWMQDETSRIEDALLEKASVDAILRAFSQAKSASFENMLEPLLKILRLSTNLCTKLAEQPSFLKRSIERLSNHSKAVVRLNLLRLIKLCIEATSSTSPSLARNISLVAKQPDLLPLVKKLAEMDPSLLVKNLAKEVVKDLLPEDSSAKSARDANGKDRNGERERRVSRPPVISNLAKSDMKRTWSDPSVSSSLRPQYQNTPSLLGPSTGIASPRIRVKSRPQSPNPLSPPLHSSSLSSSSSSASLSSLSSQHQQPGTNSAGLPLQRRISIRAKISPPR